MTETTRAYVAMGSNLNHPLKQLASAVDVMESHGAISGLMQSAIYKNPPLGPEQPDYYNGAVAFETHLSALALLDFLQEVERQQGRERGLHWGPRTLDLDLILFGSQQINHPRLVIPHPEAHLRAFVLQPLFDIDPELVFPNGQTLKSLLDNVSIAQLTRID